MNQCKDAIDPISLEEIPSERVISFEQFGKIFCFDIQSLAKHMLTGKKDNPINRVPLSSDIIGKVDQYIDKTFVYISVIDDKSGKTLSRTIISSMEDIGALIIKVYRSLKMLQNIGQKDLYSASDTSSIYSYPLDTDISSVWDKKPINLILVPDIMKGDRLHKLYLYGKDKHLEWLTNLIPVKYRKDPPKEKPYSNLDIQLLLDFVRYSIKEGKGSDYVITGMKKLLAESYINANTADHIVHALVDQFHSTYLHLIDLVYSRVTDTYNLSEKGLGRKYATDRYNIPFVEDIPIISNHRYLPFPNPSLDMEIYPNNAYFSRADGSIPAHVVITQSRDELSSSFHL